MKMKDKKSVKRGERIKRDSRKQEEREKRGRMGGGLTTREHVNVGAKGGGTKVASNFSLLSSEMTLQI